VTDILSTNRCALMIAHPGHEIRVHAWLEQAQPLVYVLTDGSGFAGRSRLESTTRLLRRAGARRGAIYGRYTDHQIYQAVLTHDHQLFVGIAQELAAEIEGERIELIVGDAQEGAILTHDVWRCVIDSAIALAEQRTGRRIQSFDFFLEASPLAAAAAAGNLAIPLRLDEPAWQRKLAAARSYPELREDVERALAAFGEDAFRLEYLRPVAVADSEGATWLVAPQYERHGESQVKQGRYAQVIRYAEHVAPLRQALLREAA
jgi:hypothetical protein